MNKQSRPSRKRQTKKERAAALLHKYLVENAPELLSDKEADYTEMHKRLVEEMRPQSPYEDLLVRQIAQAMWGLTQVREAEHVIWSMQERIEFAPFMDMVDHLAKTGEVFSRAFDRAVKYLQEGQKIRRRMPGLLESLKLPDDSAQQPGQRIRRTTRYALRQNPETPFPIKEEDLAGKVDPSTGKKTPWLN